jgi:CheY-like chemotaxis protein/anti-sigma regulatory factor (Ser/Thr protein kinase)
MSPFPTRILIADDDTAVSAMLAKTLREAGYDVDSARDGEEALAKLSERPFDVVLTDVWMPRLTGLELLARLRNRPSPPRVIVMTGDGEPVTAISALRENACEFITKPFTVAALRERIERALASPPAEPPIEVVSLKADWIELLVPCERACAERIPDFLLHLDAELAEDVRDSIGVAFRELLMNAVEWGGEWDPAKRVRISAIRGDRVLIYRIADPGSGFRMDNVPHAAVSNTPDDPAAHLAVRERLALRPGGFGLVIVRAIADELIYNEKHNEVVFMKYLK